MLPEELVDRFWQRMGRMYGHRWVSSYGPSDKDGTWAEGLADLSNGELRRGFLACVKSGKEWPPSLPEFRVMCRPLTLRRENESMYRIPASHQLTQQLSDEARAAGRAAIAQAKAAARRVA